MIFNYSIYKQKILVLFGYFILFMSGNIFPQNQSFKLTSHSFCNGFAITITSNARIKSSVGQFLIGNSHNSSGTYINSGFLAGLPKIVVGMKNDEIFSIPTDFFLNQNYPNPFNPITHIQYGLPKPSHVKLEVFNLIGQKVATLVNLYQPAGFYKIGFDGRSYASGMYVYRVVAGDFVGVRRMLLIK